MFACNRCHKTFSKVPVWPLRCSCGHKTTFEESKSATWVFPKLPNLWHAIHGRIASQWNASAWDADTERRWYETEWLPQIPDCCGQNWATLARQHAIDWSSPATAFESFWHLHNQVSLHHSNRPTITLAEAQGLFRCPVPKKDKAVITCAIGAEHAELLDRTRPFMRAYARKCGADYIEFNDDHRPDWPMANKYRMASFAWHYDQSLMVDCDVLILPDAPDIFAAAADAPIAARDEKPDYRPTDWYQAECPAFYDSQAVAFEPTRCINAGVMVFRADAVHLYHEPPKPYPKYWCAEQFWLWYQTRDVPVHWLDDRFNWAAIRVDFYDGLHEAWFVHLNGMPHADRLRLLADLNAKYRPASTQA